METYSQRVKVPKDRIAVIIGQKGVVKRALQQHSGISMNVDSKEGEVTLTGEDSVSLYQAREIIKAIARGFNPDIAQLLFRQDYVLETINLQDYANTKESVMRLRGRVIGNQGKSRQRIEMLTETFLSVYGKTITIVGEMQRATVAKRAVEKLLTGSMHSTIWRFLEKMQRKLRADELLNP